MSNDNSIRSDRINNSHRRENVSMRSSANSSNSHNSRSSNSNNSRGSNSSNNSNKSNASNRNHIEKESVHTNVQSVVTTSERRRKLSVEKHFINDKKSIISENPFINDKKSMISEKTIDSGGKTSQQSKKHSKNVINANAATAGAVAAATTSTNVATPIDTERMSLDATSNQEVYAAIVESLIQKLEDEKQQQRIWREDMARSIADMEKKVKNRINELNLLFRSAKDEIIKRLAENGIEYNETKFQRSIAAQTNSSPARSQNDRSRN